MKISYDYHELIKELKGEVNEGILTLNDEIQILRGTPRNKYQPIIDWYYNHNRMIKILTPDIYNSTEDNAHLKILKKQYKTDKPNLISITVAEALEEMKRLNKIISQL